MLLSGEEEIRREIQQKLAPEFLVASEVFFTSWNCLRDGSKVHIDQDKTGIVCSTGIGLIAKASKQFRGICTLAAMGFDDPAVGLARILYETMLAVRFILSKDVVLKENQKSLPRIGGKELTPDFRCNMYLAREVFQNLKAVNAIQNTSGLCHLHSAEDRENAMKTAEQFKAMLGPEWTKRVQEKGRVTAKGR